ncbi:hypothetical protein JY01_72 [Escherichia phage JY01]|uniref:FRD2 protein n=1 Tax=Shigella phage Sf23 TaxID=2024321 RepID=A0A291AZP7_9CAUD|nr:hypothetical protein KMC33_gp086 [Shigella phage Sf23]ATE86496.1 hypothetical protein Sf23_gp86 [Shigella phage Sf23]WRO06301.1 hypothetical protein JY01_72 [Escherichia phage JY01]
MYIGKKYELVPSLIDAFISHSPRSNGSIVKIIKENGGWFEVKEVFFNNGFKAVKHIECANGKHFYFCDRLSEICEDEFYCFREYKEPISEDEGEDTISGVTKIHCIVDENNVDRIIELLRKTFKK